MRTWLRAILILLPGPPCHRSPQTVAAIIPGSQRHSRTPIARVCRAESVVAQKSHEKTGKALRFRQMHQPIEADTLERAATDDRAARANQPIHLRLPSEHQVWFVIH